MTVTASTPAATPRRPEMHVLLSGIVGSTAYGLAGPDSDVDRLGIFAWPTERWFGLNPPPDCYVTTKPDCTMHEVAKGLRLILGGNPTASEILWLDPESGYEVRTALGDELIGIRSAFLSAKRTKDAYLGYATQQFKKLLSRGDGSFDSDIPARRAAKHSRHLMRLVDQGFELYSSGHLRIKVDDPQRYLDFGEQCAADPQAAVPFMADAEAKFAEARTVLPDEPDRATVEDWLRRVRAEYYTPTETAP